MMVTRTSIPDVLILTPEVYRDARGFFVETYRKSRFEEVIGRSLDFEQDSHSASTRGVLRGLHYQVGEDAQGKLVRVTVGEVFDVGVDLRGDSETYGEWVGVRLSAETHEQLWLPPGFAHGFLVTSEVAEIEYKSTRAFAPASERTLAWDDPDVAIDWPLQGVPILSEKDARAASFREAEPFVDRDRASDVVPG